MRAFVMVAALVAVILLALFVIFHDTGCASMKDPVCSAIAKGIARIDEELAGDATDDDAFVIYKKEIVPVLRMKGIEDVAGEVKEYWDGMSTEDKLKAARAVLVFMQGQYCEGSGGCSKSPSEEKMKSAILGIVRVYAGPALPGKREQNVGGGR